MTGAFSWSDRLNACLPCLRPSPSAHSLSSPSQDQLRRLLTDPGSSSLDGETHSLHSNPGNLQGRRRKRKRRNFNITLFGYHLFGRPIQLPSDTDDPLYHSNRITAPGPITATTTVQSTTTLDSDAAPLDADTIDSISARTAAAAIEAEEEERKQKEERRRKRREKREMKKMAKALAVSTSEGGDFEGFQGSGDGYPGIPSPFFDESQERPQEQRTPSPISLLPHLAITQEDEDEGADLDGVVYTRRRVPPGQSLNGGSDSRSRTSTSLSDRPAYRLQEPTPTKPKSSSSAKKKSKKPKPKSATNSSNTADSTSLASPTSPSFFPPEDIDTSITTVLSPSTIEQGQGFFDLNDHHHEDDPPVYAKKSPVGDTGFPSTGFGRGLGSGYGNVRLGKVFDSRGVDDDRFDGTF